MAIDTVKPGFATTVQDLGRPGYYHLGIPLSGAMDRYALRAANLLVGNDEGDAGLEAVFIGPELHFTVGAIVAVTGAELPPQLDGAPCPTWTAFSVRAGQTLSFGVLKRCARPISPSRVGSRAARPRQPLDLRALHAGRLQRAGAAGGRRAGGRRGKRPAKEGKAVPEALRRGPGAAPELRVLTGLYWDRITAESGERFFEDTWKVAPEADRIGYRFRGGRPLRWSSGSNPSAPAPIPAISSTAAIPMARSRCRAGPSRSCCTATPSPAAATS